MNNESRDERLNNHENANAEAIDLEFQSKFNHSILVALLSSEINFDHFKINDFIKVNAQYEFPSRVLRIYIHSATTSGVGTRFE